MTSMRDVAGVVHGEVVREAEFRSIGFLQHQWPEMLTFVESREAIARLAGVPNAVALLSTAALVPLLPEHLGVIVVDAPRRSLFDLHEHLVAHTTFYGAIGPTEIPASARVHPRAWIAERGVRLGERVVVEPNATILEGTAIDDDSVIRAGTVVGSMGFQASLDGDRVRRLTHAGGVRIGRNVEVQSNCTIDRALFGGNTVLNDEVTMDNLVYIAHHVSLGRQCRVGASATILGSVRVGARAWIGPGACVRDGLTIGDDANVSLGSVVTQDVGAGERVTGNFAVPHDVFMRNLRGSR